jgi:hypothetical protein
MDHVHETMKMTLAIPGTSLRDLLGLTRISPDYHLQVTPFKFLKFVHYCWECIFLRDVIDNRSAFPPLRVSVLILQSFTLILLMVKKTSPRESDMCS